MEDFKVDGILCRVDEPLGVSHTGSSPYCYDGDVIVGPCGELQVYAQIGNRCWRALFSKDDSDVSIRNYVTAAIRTIRKRLLRKDSNA